MGLNDSFLIVFYENYKKLPIFLVKTRVFTRQTSDYFRKNGPKKTHQNFNEIGKKSKNGVHFISSVFKVVRVKVLSVLLFFAYFILFWGGSKCSHFFFQKVFSKRVKKGMKTAKTAKKIFFLLNQLLKLLK